MQHYLNIDWNQVKRQQEIVKGTDQTIFTFDIEVSSGYIPPGSDTVLPFDYSKEPKFYRECKKVSLCYLWQFGINDNYYYGRELYEFMAILEQLDKLPGEKICWIHNASYEQNFLLNLFFPEKLFAKKPHSVVYFTYKKVTFRCTYQLTNLSLRSWAKDLGGVPKLENYDYDKIRTPKTPLTAFEKEYGQRDLEIVYAGIRKIKQDYILLQNIPLTQTAQIRAEVLDLFAHDMAYKRHMARLLPRSPAEYARQRMCFFGGNVHANWYYAGLLCEGVNSDDIASSYPYCCLTEPLPMAPFRKALYPKRNAKKYLQDKKYRCIIEIRITNATSRMHVDYISFSKIYDIEKKVDEITGRLRNDITVENGKVQHVKGCTMMVTDIDLDIIKEVYTGEIEILNLWYSKAGYLDKRYMEYILDLYEKKTALKGVEGMEDIYLNAKQKINGIYGDFVSSLCYDDTDLLDTGEWIDRAKSPEDVQERLDYLRRKPYKLKSAYIWGVFITAAARRNHFDILKVLDKKNHIIYYDTDSVYYFGNHDHDILKYNKEKTARIDQVLTSQGIDPERSRPKDRNGKPKQMGILEAEHRNLPEFKALRAKCYGFRDERGGLHITISGVNKDKGVNALHGNLDNLNNDLVFSYQECGKKISNYTTNQPECTWIDENGVKYRSSYKYGLNLQPTKYRLALPAEFLQIIHALGSLSCKMSRMTIDKLNEIEKEDQNGTGR